MNKGLIFISFIEEAVLNSNYYGYIGGRIEVQRSNDQLPSEEIRFFTKNTEEFYEFRDRWDMKEVTEEQLDYIRDRVAFMFFD